MNNLKILQINFNLPIRQSDIPKFRGAVIASMNDANPLFHNHIGNSYRYSYPLIQYKKINGNAAILSIGEGVEIIGDFFNNLGDTLHIGNREVPFSIRGVMSERVEFGIVPEYRLYEIHNWLPLNQENYNAYNRMDGILERYAMLEKILTGNILSFAKGVGIFFDSQVITKIQSVTPLRSSSVKEVKMSTFDIVFRSNVSLPDYIGLGQKASMGFGILTVRNNQHKNQ